MTDASTMRTSLIAAAINITYICIYLYYANENDRLAAWRQISSGLALVAALLAYIVAEDPKVLPFRFRLIYTTIILLPFLGLVRLLFALNHTYVSDDDQIIFREESFEENALMACHSYSR